ncbi:unnamed protein product [Candidula unifasciata]|uniref:Protein-lysine N-methyltransferase SMYD4 n=1 Tax=Candidula unifasciata TaxID=100452 RepID=A0A8S3YM83_9EUPU|nr:unnamed protein product [Candidula unifasciata]
MSPNKVATIRKDITQWLKDTNQYNEFVQNFQSCHTNADRVACLYKLPITKNVLTVQENFKGKDKVEADLLREKGNKLFKAKNYLAALNTYSQSIILAPDNCDILPLVYNNRSTSSFYLKHYALCLQDIELAFMHNYPPASCYRLFVRKGKCMYYLNHKEEAIKSFQQSLVVLERSELNEENKRSTIAEIQSFLDLCEDIRASPSSLSTNSYNCCHSGIPDLNSPPSKEVPCMSEDLEIRLDSYGGRGIFANRDIDIGTVLIIETPFSSFLLKEFNTTHCHYCCNRVFLPLPCRQCSAVVFCSLNCRHAAWVKFHWAECRILGNILDTQGALSLLAARMVLTAGLDELVKSKETCDDGKVDRTAGFDDDGVYNSENYATSYSLVNHADKREFNDLFYRTISALFFLQNLEVVGYFSEGINPNVALKNSNEVSEQALRLRYLVGGHILRNTMMLPCNAHEVSEFCLNMNDPPMSVTLEIGGGVYPVLSLLNHSCDPSVVRHSYGNICVVRAIRGIRKGEELKDNYGAMYATHEMSARVEKLSQYFFCCSCEACLGNWPQYFEIPNERPVFRCVQCDGQVPIPAGNQTELARCTSCNVVQDITLTVLQMRDMEGAYKDALTAVVNGSSSNAHMSVLLNYLRFVDKHVHRPFRDINDCQEAIKQVLNIHANCFPGQL